MPDKRPPTEEELSRMDVFELTAEVRRLRAALAAARREGAAAEREACAVLMDEFADQCRRQAEMVYAHCAAAFARAAERIRARQ